MCVAPAPDVAYQAPPIASVSPPEPVKAPGISFAGSLNWIVFAPSALPPLKPVCAIDVVPP